VKPERALAGLARVAKVVSAPFVRIDMQGAEKINDEIEVCILAANHRSLFDVAAGLIAFHRYRRYPRVLIEKKYVDSKWTRPFARAIGAIPVDREAGHGQAFAAAVAALHDGLTILVLPEGRLHWDPTDPISTGRASTGVSRLAEASGMPVVAAGMVGTEEVWPASSPLPRFNPFRRRRPVTIRVSDVPVSLTGDDHRARTDQVMASVRDQMRRAAAAHPDGPTSG
jgi:putative phosphoserine phosphatase/1-acylglycerol-3-phosphate O-acyltransferase